MMALWEVSRGRVVVGGFIERGVPVFTCTKELDGVSPTLWTDGEEA